MQAGVLEAAPNSQSALQRVQDLTVRRYNRPQSCNLFSDSLLILQSCQMARSMASHGLSWQPD
jgi:hypothetical protein